MKILYHHRIRSKDGQAVHLEELVGAFRDLGHDVSVVGPQSFARASFGDDPKLLGQLKRILPKALYEVLELGYNIPAYMRLSRARQKQSPDIIYERYNLYSLAGVWLSKRTGVPLLLEVNAPLARERATYGSLGLPWLASWLEHWAWRHAAAVLPVTAVLASEMRTAGVRPERIFVIPNAIDPKRFVQPLSVERAKAELGLSDQIVLGFTGFMRHWHGLDQVISWLGRPDSLQRLHLVLVGDGPALSALKAQTAALGLASRVTFTGLVDRDAIARVLAAFDIALQPKAVAYASPLKLFEYMALGKAIVAPDQPNIREVLVHDVSALLFDPARPDQLTDAIAQLAADTALRQRLGKAAHEAIALRSLTWSDNAKQVLTIARALDKVRADAAAVINLKNAS